MKHTRRQAPAAVPKPSRVRIQTNLQANLLSSLADIEVVLEEWRMEAAKTVLEKTSEVHSSLQRIVNLTRVISLNLK